jgi:hypothetical protein
MSFSDFELPIAFGRGRSVVAFFPTTLLLTFLASERTEFGGPLFATGSVPLPFVNFDASIHCISSEPYRLTRMFALCGE